MRGAPLGTHLPAALGPDRAGFTVFVPGHSIVGKSIANSEGNNYHTGARSAIVLTEVLYNNRHSW